MDATYDFAQNFVNVTFDDLPTEVVEITKKEVLDTSGSCCCRFWTARTEGTPGTGAGMGRQGGGHCHRLQAEGAGAECGTGERDLGSHTGL